MNWLDIDDILFDGTKEEIENINCPDCGGEIEFEYFPEADSISTFCSGCGILERAHGCCQVPNFYKFGLNKKIKSGVRTKA